VNLASLRVCASVLSAIGIHREILASVTLSSSTYERLTEQIQTSCAQPAKSFGKTTYALTRHDSSLVLQDERPCVRKVENESQRKYRATVRAVVLVFQPTRRFSVKYNHQELVRKIESTKQDVGDLAARKRWPVTYETVEHSVS
jgi:hypothetical protein